MGNTAQPRLIVGLGNPLEQYSGTRHNVGREFVGWLAAESKSSLKKYRQAEGFRLPDFFGVPVLDPILCVVLKSFMNLSGEPVRDLLKYESLTPENLLVVVDDFSIPFGALRIRPAGSSGGHNGLKSIIETLGTDEFPRLRVGIGPVPAGSDPADFVLKNFSKAERSKQDELFLLMQKGLIDYFSGGMDKAMGTINKLHF